VSELVETDGLCVAHLIANAATVASVAAWESALAQSAQRRAEALANTPTSNGTRGRST
jgi:hypothetical protein